jgi:hypothetical protein
MAFHLLVIEWMSIHTPSTHSRWEGFSGVKTAVLFLTRM